MDYNKLTKQQLIELLKTKSEDDVDLNSSLDNNCVNFLFENTCSPLLVFSIDQHGSAGNFTNANQAACSFLSYTTKEIKNLCLKDILPEGYSKVADKFLKHLIKQKNLSQNVIVLTKNQENIPAKITATLFSENNRQIVLTLLKDLTDTRKSELLLRRDYKNNKRLLRLFLLAPDMGDQELFNYILDTAVNLTDSKIGFFHEVSDDQNTIILTAWNKETLKDCEAAFNAHYPIDIAGNWVDCIKEKKPIIYNDFKKSPNQKGLPEGHVALDKFMSIPVIENQKVRYIFGVGNKDSDYTNNDIIQVQLITNELVKLLERRKAEVALKKSEERFKALFEAANDAIFIMKDYKFIDCNQKTLEIFGCNRSQIINKTPHDFSPKKQSDNSDSKKCAENRIKKTLKGKPQVFEWIHKKLNGELFNAEVSLNKIDLEDHAYIQAIVRDITQRKKSEEQIRNLNEQLEQKVKERTRELKLSEQKFRDISELLPQTIFETDIKGNLTYSNKYGYKLSGYSLQDFKKGISIFQLIEKSEQAKLKANLKQKLNNKNSIANEYTLVTKNGKKKPVLIYSSPIIRNDKVEGLRGILVDISSRLKNEEELKKLSQAIEQSPASVVITNLEADIIYVNNAFSEISGYKKSEVLGQNPRVLKSDYHPKSYYQNLWETILSGKTWKGEFKNKRKNGEEYWEYASISPIIDKNNKPVSFVAVKEDITERKKIEQELIRAKEAAESATKAKTRFLANMSHEIRTPMNAVLGFTELLLTMVKDEQQRSYLLSLHSSGNTLLSIINDILDLSKVEAGKLDLNYDFVDAEGFFNDFYHIFLLKAQNKGLEFRVEIDKNVPKSIYIDDLRLRQSLINLINNSVKFTNKGYIKVLVTASKIVSKKGKKYSNITIEVKDTGIGISKENQKRIFDSFTQENTQTTRTFGGTGLGLTITSNLIELMKGKLTVISNQNEGSSFSIFLPNVEVTNEVLDIAKRVNFHFQNIEFSTSTVLIVDDIENNRKYLTEAIRQLDLKAHSAENGEVALIKLEKIKPDLIITDIRMPIMNGFELLKEIRKKKHFKNIPVIATSASVIFNKDIKNKISKFDAFLSKPVLTSKLIPLLAEFLPHKKHDTLEKEIKLSSEAVKSLPKTIKALETTYYTKWTKFEKRKPVNEIKSFSEDLLQLAKESSNQLILDYAETLKKSVITFDIDEVLKLLRNYKLLIKELKNYGHSN